MISALPPPATRSSGYLRYNNASSSLVTEIAINHNDKYGTDLASLISSWGEGLLTLAKSTEPSTQAMYQVEARPSDSSLYGSGADGDVTFTVSTNLNTTAVASGRTDADMVSYNFTSLGVPRGLPVQPRMVLKPEMKSLSLIYKELPAIMVMLVIMNL